ncbi:MAG: glycosyltransferase family 2 protein [Oscillospiraceae bacterium]|jgi:cellulose synthase/poly-beta-1,6-N-acetylglucosamine synthase-like glycosyltransferase|nr:glycosyltransferase family 2 protein [Oscillospiraceae bacterium]
MTLALTIAFICCFAPLLACGLYHAAIIILGLIKRVTDNPRREPEKRIGVIIPARNEANVIRGIIASLRKQDYPKHLFDIIVIANNCTDDTAELAKQDGARVLTPTSHPAKSADLSGTPDEPIKKKGDVLAFAFAALKDEGYDVYCVLDADNLVDKRYLSSVNNAFVGGVNVAQGVRDSKNPRANVISGMFSIFYWFMSRLQNETRAALGLSCAVNGTGFAVSSAYINKIDFHPSSLTEDLELSGICALDGEKIHYMAGAVVYDEQPTTIKACFSQLRRWLGGAHQCFKLMGGRLFKKRTVHAVDMLIVYSNVIFTLLGLVSGLSTTALTVRSVIMGQIDVWSALMVSGIGLVAAILALQAGAALICRMSRKSVKDNLPAILMFPLFVLMCMISGFLLLIIGPPKTWTPIAHGGGK